VVARLGTLAMYYALPALVETRGWSGTWLLTGLAALSVVFTVLLMAMERGMIACWDVSSVVAIVPPQGAAAFDCGGNNADVAEEGPAPDGVIVVRGHKASVSAGGKHVPPPEAAGLHGVGVVVQEAAVTPTVEVVDGAVESEDTDGDDGGEGGDARETRHLLRARAVGRDAAQPAGPQVPKTTTITTADTSLTCHGWCQRCSGECANPRQLPSRAHSPPPAPRIPRRQLGAPR